MAAKFRIEGPGLGQAAACEPILRALPDWFGIEEAIVHYVTEIEQLPTLTAQLEGRVVGFLSIKQHYPCAAEMYVMGVLPAYHRAGMGRALVQGAEEYLRARGVAYLQVKTLGPSHPDPFYARTRAFYEAVGFRALEEFPQIWDAANPCLIMVKGLGEQEK